MDKDSGKNKKQSELHGAMGTVVEALPNTLFKVEIDGVEGQKLAYLAGKMRLHRIRVLVGDRVELAIDPYGGKARISRRM
ncbi:MAG: translation initiation factor IF-1 [Candidatus Pacebacteria bacterium]|nr:translation initiation factor IF-1 [Candidatus Paceibacterota bacterium]